MIDVQLGFDSHTENIMPIMPIMPIYKLNFYFVHKKSKKQIKKLVLPSFYYLGQEAGLLNS